MIKDELLLKLLTFYACLAGGKAPSGGFALVFFVFSVFDDVILASNKICMGRHIFSQYFGQTFHVIAPVSHQFGGNAKPVQQLYAIVGHAYP